MKVKDLAEKMERYDELENLKDDLEKQLKELTKKPKKRPAVTTVVGLSCGSLYISDGSICFTEDNEDRVSINVSFGTEATRLLRDDVAKILRKHIQKLEDEMDKLEVK